MRDRYEELYKSFRWNVPARYNMARACCGNWAEDRARFALYWEDESGATAAYSFWDIQQAANRLSNALAALGVKRGERVAIILPQRPETAIAYIAVFQMGAIALPLSHLFGPDALEYRMNHAGASVAIVEPTTLANLWAIKAKLPGLRHDGHSPRPYDEANFLSAEGQQNRGCFIGATDVLPVDILDTTPGHDFTKRILGGQSE